MSLPRQQTATQHREQQVKPRRLELPVPRIPSGRDFLTQAEARTALEELNALALSSEGASERLDYLVSRLRESGYTAELTEVISETIVLPNANPHLGILWMRRLTSSKSWDRSYPPQLDELCKRGGIGKTAVLELLKYAGERRKKDLALEIWTRHRHWLKERTQDWALMGAALVRNACYRKALRWLREWRERADQDLSVITSVTEALRGLGREKEAYRIIAKTIASSDPEKLRKDFPQLLLWAAAEEALAGDSAAAAQRIAELQPTGWDDHLTHVYYLVRGLVRVRQAELERRRQVFRHGYDRIRERFRRVPPHRHQRMIRRLYRRCMWQMALDAGYYRRAMLSYWRAADSFVPLIPLCLVPGLQILIPLYLLRWLRKPDTRIRC